MLLLNLKDVEKKIKLFYEKYGENPAEKMTYSEWEKYKAKLSKMAKKNPQDEFLQRLAKQNIPKYQIDRLRALELDLQMQLTEATLGQEKGIYNTLDDVARVSQSVLAKSMQASIGLKFNTIADKKLKQLLSSDWSGANWSDRLWHDRAIVGKKVTEILQKGVTQGTSLQKMARELKQATNQSFNNAFRLIRTETSYIDGQVTLDGYKQAGEELGLEYYEYDAFLDSRTSDICRELDKKRFKVSEAEIGVNYPPMHPNCRSTTQLVLDEEYKQEESRSENPNNSKEETKAKEKAAAKENLTTQNAKNIQERAEKFKNLTEKELKERIKNLEIGLSKGKFDDEYKEEIENNIKAMRSLLNTPLKNYNPLVNGKTKNEIAEEQAKKFLKQHPDYNPHYDFIKNQKKLKPYKYGVVAKKITGNTFKEMSEKAVEKSKKPVEYRKFNNKETLNEYFYNNKNYQKWLNNLTENEQEAICAYTDNSDDVNKFLRKIGDWKHINKELITGQVKQIDNALKEFILDEPMQVLRGVGEEPFKGKLENLQSLIDSTFNDKAFLSTSPLKAGAKNDKPVEMIINIPSGKGRGAYINQISVFEDVENEFLIARDSNFIIKNARQENGRYLIEMDLIDN